MKKVILAICAALLLCGCEPDSQKVNLSQDGTKIYARKFEFEGHSYIEFYRPSAISYDNYTGFVHDPNCPCMIDYD
jgi:hypothetical protein